MSNEEIMGNGKNLIMVVIPAYNEEASLGIVITKIRKNRITNARIFVCVVNDASTDMTSEIAHSQADLVIDLPVNIGVGGAVRSGYVLAQKLGIEKVIQLDADDQHDSSYIPNLLEALNVGDVVVGSRYLGSQKYVIAFVTRIAQIFISLLMLILHRVNISDPTSGYRGAKGRAIEVFASRYPSAFLQDTIGSLVIAKKNKLQIIEISTPMSPRLYGYTSINPLKRVKLYLMSVMFLILWR